MTVAMGGWLALGLVAFIVVCLVCGLHWLVQTVRDIRADRRRERTYMTQQASHVHLITRPFDWSTDDDYTD